jgi:hypothetical protein
MMYLALEPFIRRKSPHVLVSWARLLSGEWRDTLVGRDVLTGLACGVVLYGFETLVAEAAVRFGSAPPAISFLKTLGAGDFIFNLVGRLTTAGGVAVLYLCLIFFFRVNRRAGGTLIVLLFVGNSMSLSQVSGPVFGTMQSLLIVGGSMYVLMRFGLVALVVKALFEQSMRTYPITFHSSAWYASTGYAAMLVLAAIAIYGFRTSLGSRSILETLDSNV